MDEPKKQQAAVRDLVRGLCQNRGIIGRRRPFVLEHSGGDFVVGREEHGADVV